MTVVSVTPFLLSSGEADLVLHHVTSLVSSGVSGRDIAVIAPYNLQVSGRGGGGEGMRMVWVEVANYLILMSIHSA